MVAEAAVVMFRPVVTLTVSLTVIGSEWLTSMLWTSVSLSSTVTVSESLTLMLWTSVSLSLTVMVSESLTSIPWICVSLSDTVMVSLSVTWAGPETELLQVTETLLMLAEATVPEPLVTVQASPVGCVPTVTAYIALE